MDRRAKINDISALRESPNHFRGALRRGREGGRGGGGSVRGGKRCCRLDDTQRRETTKRVIEIGGGRDREKGTQGRDERKIGIRSEGMTLHAQPR